MFWLPWKITKIYFGTKWKIICTALTRALLEAHGISSRMVKIYCRNGYWFIGEVGPVFQWQVHTQTEVFDILSGVIITRHYNLQRQFRRSRVNTVWDPLNLYAIKGHSDSPYLKIPTE